MNENKRKKNKISTYLSLLKIKHDLIVMIFKYQHKMLYFGKTQAMLNQLA